MAEKKADKQKFVEGREVISITVMLRQRCFVFEERNTGHEESQGSEFENSQDLIVNSPL